MVRDMIVQLRAALMVNDVDCWIGEAQTACSADELLLTRNAIVPLSETRKSAVPVIDAMPAYFNLSATTFDFEQRSAVAKPERWLEFLREVFDCDEEQIATPQQWFGYCLTADTSRQKMPAIIGPKRSGKGTIARILTAMPGGPANVASPSVAAIARNFGLQSLIGKPLATITDARVTGKSDIGTFVERILTITGEDQLQIGRKYKTDWIGRLPTRLMLLSNELPKVTDVSGAFVSRMILLHTPRSFFGAEDLNLEKALVAELPGILWWAIDGWRALTKFEQPEVGRPQIEQLGDMSSPVSAFVRECCGLGPGSDGPKSQK